MAIHFVIYEKPNCESCRLTKRWLAEHGQHFRTTNHRGESNLVDINANDPLKRAWSHQKIVKFREAGYDRFPVVRVRDDATGDVQLLINLGKASATDMKKHLTVFVRSGAF